MTRVLIADDHPFLCEGVKAVLVEAGMTVVDTVGDGDAALDAIARHDPDVVILDVTMPGRDGISTLQAMREKADQRPVVLLTAHITDRQLVAAVRAGTNAIVLKQGASGVLADAIGIVRQGGQVIAPDLMARAVEASARLAVSRDPLARLSARERDIARAVGQGLRNREIAERFGVSEGAIKVMLYRVYEKLGVENRTMLALRLRESGALDS
jgi:two-component system nitrate/nitrite response regulator NarL